MPGDDMEPLARFLQRLLKRSRLNAEEQQAILSLSGETLVYSGHRDIVSPGEIVERSALVVSGLAGRFDQMRDGQRQITAFHIPGDMCDLHSAVAPKASWSITPIGSATVLKIPHADLLGIAARYPAIAMAFWRDTVVDGSILQKWVGNLGRKSALARLAHILCELGMRIENARLGSRTAFTLQATQEQLADATGMTPVHMNRMLQELRARNILSFRSGNVDVHDWDGLASVAEFDPIYLLMDRVEDATTLVRGATQPAAG